MQSNRLQKFFDRYVGIPISILLSIINFFQTFLNRKVKSSHRNEADSPKKILFIQLSALGDTILAIPTIHAIQRSFPQAELSFLASSTNLSYLERCPYIDRRILFRYPLHQLVWTLRQERFDWVIDLEHWSRFSVILTYATGAPRLIGFSALHQYRHYLFTDIVLHVPGKHEVLNFLSIAHELGCSPENTELAVWIGETEHEWCQNLLAQEQVDSSVPLVVLHPEAGRRGEPRRRWPRERYVTLADMLASRYNAQIVLTGAPDEVAVSQWIAERTACETVCLAGQTQVNQLTALFAQADLVISGNCGPMHLAAAAGTPVIALHGPTNAVQWGPWTDKATCLTAAVPCSPCLNLGFEYACQALPDGTSPCMHTIAMSEVLQACEVYLG
jgi:lipopolysaccharide heptosyltransferase II